LLYIKTYSLYLSLKLKTGHSSEFTPGKGRVRFAPEFPPLTNTVINYFFL